MFQMCGPTGIGFLYGKFHLLSGMPPFLGKLDWLKVETSYMFRGSKSHLVFLGVLREEHWHWYDLKLILMLFSRFLGGGEMISDVFLDHSTYAEPPSRFVQSLLFGDFYYTSTCNRN